MPTEPENSTKPTQPPEKAVFFKLFSFKNQYKSTKGKIKVQKYFTGNKYNSTIHPSKQNNQGNRNEPSGIHHQKSPRN